MHWLTHIMRWDSRLMHWILTIPQDFSLKEVIQRSRWLLLPPFAVCRVPERLERVERLTSGPTTLIHVSQVPAGLHIHVDLQLNGNQAEELTQKVWRMLRLGETFGPFLQRARSDVLLRPWMQYGVRFLRGADFFEDLIKAVVLSYHTPYNAALILTWLVDGLGDPLPSNPTRHAFPTAAQLLNHREETLCILNGELGARILQVAAYYSQHAEVLEALSNMPLTLTELFKYLDPIPGMDANVKSYLLLALGRYDYIPAQNGITPPDEIENLVDWQPWGGLVYWLKKAPRVGNPGRGVS